MKKIKIALVTIGLAVAGVAGAAVVNHLSDAVKTTAAVTLPVEMSVNEGADGSWTGNKSISVTTTGGSDFTFTTVAKNNANNTINGYPVTVVVAPNGKNFTGGEIDKVMFGDANYWPEANMIDITSMLYVVYSDGSLHKLSNWTGDSKKLVLFFDNNDDGTAQVYPLTAGEVSWNVLAITPHQAIAPGTYKIYSQYVDDLADYAAEQYN